MAIRPTHPLLVALTARWWLIALTLLLPAAAWGQGRPADLVAIGLQQLDAARAAPSAAAFETAEATFTKVLAQDPDDPRALVHRGEARLARGGGLAAAGQISTAVAMIQAAMADMDRAVSLAPDQLDVRLTRGLAYAGFPAYYSKADTARADLEAARADRQFASLPEARRTRAMQALERLKTPALADVHRDRFPNIPADTAPILVVVSITFPATYASRAQPRMDEIGRAVEGFAGLLDKHLVASLDKPGMFIIFTWWSSKQAASDFYYSDLHQSWLRGRGQAITSAPNIPEDAIPTQVGVEVLTGLPGGVQVNGGFVPRDLFERLQRHN
jgi:tetratricopeptide (TPR) repeat protein